MVEIFKPIIDLLTNPLSHLFKTLGFGDKAANAFAAVLLALIFYLIIILLKDQFRRFKNRRSARDLKPEFDYKTIKGFREIFIPSRYDRISPNRYDNPHEAHKHSEPRKLIPFMLKKSFNERVENEKFYLILGDSGMGKTAFMVNLYIKFHSVFRFNRNHKMKLFRFQPPDIDDPEDVIERIKKIDREEAKNTILLLDGLDEDPYILSKDPKVTDDAAFEKRLNNIASSTKNFCDVVITCRTQYFPQEELQDYVLSIRKPDGGFFKLNKYYLFPFSDKEVKKYLRKKYGVLRFWNRPKKKKAKLLVENSHKLMSRPMLLSYLDDLVVEEDVKYRNCYQIYETLIEKWIDRESKKCKKPNEQEKFKKNLRKLAHETALDMYAKWQSEGVLFLKKEDTDNLANKYNIELKPEEVKGKSLLTCDPLRNWKFAHKSILEYFLAIECFNKLEFAVNFNFTGMDMVKHFYEEMQPFINATDFVKVEFGVFKMGDEYGDLGSSEKPVHDVKISDFYMSKTLVTQKF